MCGKMSVKRRSQGDEFGDKRERDAENRVGEIGCSCILTSRWENRDEVRLPLPDLFICLRDAGGLLEISIR